MLSNTAIQDFIKVYLQETGVRLSELDAKREAESLMSLIKRVTETQNKEKKYEKRKTPPR